jgi:transcriptional regulator with XRE-family HTH domain
MDENPQPRLGARLRRARMRLELTQAQVAREVGFVTTVYGRIERGDMLPSVPKLRELCLLLGISADVLLSLRPAERTEPSGPNESPELRRLSRLVCALPPDRFELFRQTLQELTGSIEE